MSDAFTVCAWDQCDLSGLSQFELILAFQRCGFIMDFCYM